MGKINIQKYRKSGSKIFSGRNVGIQARKEENLMEKDEDDDVYDIIVPDDTYSISGSFFGGMFSDSVIRLKEDGFRKKYKFKHRNSELNESLNDDIEEGIYDALNIFDGGDANDK